MNLGVWISLLPVVKDKQGRLVLTLLAAEMFEESKIVLVAVWATTIWLWERNNCCGCGAQDSMTSWS